jgi:molecular chaperone GrpE (heat shock protein)
MATFGPNDFHIDKNGEIAPGLGKDEPSEIAKKDARAAGTAAQKQLQAELAAQAGELSAQERQLNAEREALAREQAQVAEQKKELERLLAEAKAAAPKGAGK